MPIICADDFGMSPAISEGILDLCEAKKIQAVSVMSESSLLSEYVHRLAPLKKYIQFGLHFNLTHPFEGEMYKLIYLLAQPVLREKDRLRIQYCLHHQLDLFEQNFHQAPRYIDGHEHVHIFPAVRKLFITECAKRYKRLAKRPWIRQVSHPLKTSGAKCKSVILNTLNMGFSKLCSEHGFATNKKFAGVYSLSPKADYASLFKTWMQEASDDTLIMCHPSKTGDRMQEYQALFTY